MLTREFILAGDAIFTLEVPAEFQQRLGCKPHYTYHVTKTEASDRWPAAWFVKLLTGPEEFSYIGKLDDFTGQLKLTAKSILPADADPVRLLNRVLARVWSNDHAAFEQHGFRLHHEGKCGRCGRALTVPASIESGIGPECAKRLSMAN